MIDKNSIDTSRFSRDEEGRLIEKKSQALVEERPEHLSSHIKYQWHEIIGGKKIAEYCPPNRPNITCVKRLVNKEAYEFLQEKVRK